MPLDAVCLSALASELNSRLYGARVDKIVQPSKDEVHLIMRGQEGGLRLLLSASAQHPRAHITKITRENPAVPPMFCMLLRKHLTGARFAGVRQPSMERVLIFIWDAADDMGEPVQKQLVCELMGRHANIILVGADGRIIFCLRRVDYEMSEKRQVLPGLFYHLPPTQGKIDPMSLTEDQLSGVFAEVGTPDEKWLLNTFEGLSPLICRELAYEGLPWSFFRLLEDIKVSKFLPAALEENGEMKDFSFREIRQYGNLYAVNTDFESFSDMLDSFYTRRDIRSQMNQRVSSLMKLAVNQRDRLVRKLKLQAEELEEAKDRERLREYGDLLMANLNKAVRGMKSVRVTDFYHPEQAETDIKLDEQKSPQQNAAKYYKDYTKAKNAEESLSGQIIRGEQELAYWESVIEELSRVSSEKEFEEIREELTPSRSKKKVKEKAALPQRFISSEGIVFYAGRNNRQNDQLTMKMASKNDIWMHAQKIPGCHVIIDTSNGHPGEITLLEAAAAAAYYSQGKNSPKVAVDYTSVKYVKKPGGAKPGMVIYDKFKTILVKPGISLNGGD